jgi:hypothetical protein
VVADLPVRCRIFAGAAVGARTSRQVTLTGAVDALVDLGVSRIVVERDDTVARHDLRILHAAARKAPLQLEYAPMAPHQEPMLWVPDAVAWCWTKDRTWRALIEHLVDGETAQ